MSEPLESVKALSWRASRSEGWIRARMRDGGLKWVETYDGPKIVVGSYEKLMASWRKVTHDEFESELNSLFRQRASKAETDNEIERQIWELFNRVLVYGAHKQP